MSDIVNIAGRAASLDKADKLAPFTKVRIYVNDDEYFEAGDDESGRLLEVDNPFGTQEMADDMLAKLSGKQYQPFEAISAQVDPAVEMGDGITVSDVYSGLYKSKLTFSSLMTSDISAPFEDEIDREYRYESVAERKFSHQIDSVRASLIIAQNEIRADVVRKQGPEETAFGWSLMDDGHQWFANGDRQNPVMKITASGLYVRGQIEASGGHIGGFNITDTTISNWRNTGNGKHSGIWISTVPYTTVEETNPSYNDVLQVGDDFHVKDDGSIRATGGTIGGFTITASKISNWDNSSGIWMSTVPYTRYDDGSKVPTSSSYYNDVLTIGSNFHVKSDGSVVASKISALTIEGNLVVNNSTYTPAQVSGGIGGGRAFSSASEPGGSGMVSSFRAGVVYAANALQIANTSGFQFGTDYVYWMSRIVKDSNGNDITIRYLGRA